MSYYHIVEDFGKLLVNWFVDDSAGHSPKEKKLLETLFFDGKVFWSPFIE